jgi:hypothetical protein
LLAGILAMMASSVAFVGVALLVVEALRQLAWGVVNKGLDARMAVLGWDQPGSRVFDEDLPAEGSTTSSSSME